MSDCTWGLAHEKKNKIKKNCTVCKLLPHKEINTHTHKEISEMGIKMKALSYNIPIQAV